MVDEVAMLQFLHTGIAFYAEYRYPEDKLKK